MNLQFDLDEQQLDAAIKKQITHIETVVQQALDEFGEKCVAAIQASAPVRTGRLRDSFTYEIQEDGVLISSGIEYGVFVEYGTVNQAAQPFFEISIRQFIPDLISQLEREIPL